MKHTFKGLKLTSLWTRLYYLPYVIRRILFIVTAFGFSFDSSL